MGSTIRGAWPALAAVALCAAAASTLAYTLAAVCRLHVPLPYWDEWYTVDHFRRFAEGRYSLAVLASQHNEHRLLFPRLFFFADEQLTGLSGWLDAAVTLLLQAATAALLIRLAAALVAPAVHRALLAGFVVLLLFTLRQEQNFTNGFQLQFVGVFTAASLAAAAHGAALDRLRDGRRGAVPFFALATLGCLVATFTMANGVLAGAVLAAAAALRRAPWRFTAATAAMAAGLAALFFHGYVPSPTSLPPGQVLSDPLPYLAYVAAYLGNPIEGTGAVPEALGALGLALAAAAAWRVARAGGRGGAEPVLLAVAGFVLASAAATAYGRAPFGVEQAAESRYATPSLVFWCATVLFWFPVALRRGCLPAAAAGALMALLAGAALRAEATAWPALAERSTALRGVADSLAAGLYDADAAAVYESTPVEDIRPAAAFLRQHGLGPFAGPDAVALGRPVADAGRVAPPAACEGSVAARADPALGPRGVRVDGTARDRGTGRAPVRILLADGTGTVVGFGSASLPSRPSRLWSGYAAAEPGSAVAAYARLADGALCRLGSAVVE